jgi:two-component system, OmpR family, phosphate regulon sensor histidine kinase PhoR
MRPSTVKSIIIISSFALVGLVFTQTFWIREEIRLSSQQFDHRADYALRDVIEELRGYVADSCSRMQADTACSLPAKQSCSGLKAQRTFFDVIDTLMLDSLIRKYISYHLLDTNYYYSIIRNSDCSVVFRSRGYPAIAPAIKPHNACLSRAYKGAHSRLSVYFPQKNKVIFANLGIWLALTLVFMSIIIYGVTSIITTFLKQKKLTEMKNDFINNVTHEFKTPVATIALASEVLMKTEDPKTILDRVKRYSKIIYDENERLRVHVERVLEVAQQDHHEIKMEPVEINLHEVIQSVVSSMYPEKAPKPVKVQYKFEASDPVIKGDLMYINGIISNITENAMKYSVEKPELNIVTANHEGYVVISFIDNGIGMSREAVKHIFEKFYRVPTGNVHNVKGFGLGLYYVKEMVEAHGGFIKVTSELNHGSRFDVYLPAMNNLTMK